MFRNAAFLSVIVSSCLVGNLLASDRVSSIEIAPESERAINRALTYLASVQNDNGSWGEDKYYVANTSLSVMAFMVQGHVPSRGKYGRTLERGIDYLLDRSALRADGYVVDDSSGTMYQHCLAVMALAEAWGQSKDPRLGPAVRKGAKILVKCQGKDGGWRYSPKPSNGDLSVTIMAIEALVSAKESGIFVPDYVWENARQFIYDCQQSKGHFGYVVKKADEANSYRMGAGLLGLQLAGDRDSERVKTAWATLMGPAVEKGWAFKARGDNLDQFYCVQACYQGGDKFIQSFYPRVAKMLVSEQQSSGKIRGDHDLPHGGTAVAALILAVPYRYLPIFQR